MQLQNSFLTTRFITVSKAVTNSKIPVVVIFAPTATGKTALTRELFSEKGSHFIFKAQIISADSQCVYKGLDIGTAKPDAALLQEIPHHLVNILSPDKQFNVSDFVDMADEACRKIWERGELPVVCGGTGFYIRNFLYGVPKTPESDSKLREELKQRIAVEGNAALYEELKKVDPESAQKIHLNDAYRICRALEVFYLSGKSRTNFKLEPKLRENYNFLFVVLKPKREVLYERIHARVDQMFNDGLENEIDGLRQAGYGKDSPGLKAIGYSEWFEPVEGDAAQNHKEYIETVKAAIKHHSCKYAKKQFTYIKDIPGSIVLPYSGSDADLATAAQKIQTFVSEFWA